MPSELPDKRLSIEPGLQAIRPIDPSPVAIGERSPVVGFAPHEQAPRCLLERIAILCVEPLIFQTVANFARPLGFIKQSLERGKPENELTVSSLPG